MSMPELPEGKDFKDALVDLLESIALEEVSLAHFVNAEAEKIQKAAKDKKMTSEEMIEFQKNISKTMRTTIKKEMLLQFKLEDILDFKRKRKKDNGCNSEDDVPCKEY